MMQRVSQMGRLVSGTVLLSCTFLLGLWPPMQANALRVATTLLDDLRASDLVAAGTILDEQPAVGVSRFILRVDDRIAGRTEAETVSVLAPSGLETESGGGLTSVTASEAVRYSIGEHVLVFLKQAPPSLLHKSNVDTAYVTIRKVRLEEMGGNGRRLIADMRRLAEAGELSDGEHGESAFLDLLSSPNDLIVESAVQELGRMKSRRAVGPLARLIRDAPVPVRFQIIDAMRQIGNEDAIAVISAALEDGSPRVRSRAASALGWMQAKGAEDTLLEMALAKDEDEGVRLNAVLALGKVGSQKAVPFLLEALKDEALGPPLRRSMQDTLKTLQHAPSPPTGERG